MTYHSPARTLLALLFLTLLSACSAAPEAPSEIQAGQTMAIVQAAAGDPDETQVFTLPEAPFFGPQEGLANLLPAGTLVEEWQYKTEELVTYVWFAGEPASREDWTVIDTATHPAGAVY